MTIQMSCSVASPGELLARGKEYDLPDERALELLKAKFAKPVPTKLKQEKALKPQGEKR